MQRGDRDAAFVTTQPSFDRGKRLLAAHEMLRHPDRDVGDRDHLAGKGGGIGSRALSHELVEAQACRVFRYIEEIAAAHVVAERRQPALFHDHEQHEAGPLARRLPQSGVAFERRVGGLQIIVGHDAEHVLGSVVVRLHPGVDVVAVLDLPFVDVRGVAKFLQLRGDPECPVAITLGVADEELGHGVVFYTSVLAPVRSVIRR